MSLSLLALGALGGVVLYSAYKPTKVNNDEKMTQKDPREGDYRYKYRPYCNPNLLDQTQDEDFGTIVAFDQSFGPQGLPRVTLQTRGGHLFSLYTTPTRLPSVCRARMY